jgi:hypothetical protein
VNVKSYLEAQAEAYRLVEAKLIELETTSFYSNEGLAARRLREAVVWVRARADEAESRACRADEIAASQAGSGCGG